APFTIGDEYREIPLDESDEDEWDNRIESIRGDGASQNGDFSPAPEPLRETDTEIGREESEPQTTPVEGRRKKSTALSILLALAFGVLCIVGGYLIGNALTGDHGSGEGTLTAQYTLLPQLPFESE
ncbi:MAG: hypothetical protein ACI4U2_03135, partial [Christensenellaceae bacterium]